MGRKKADRKTVMIRAYDDFAKKLKQVSAELGLTAAEFLDQEVIVVLDETHRRYIHEESEKLARALAAAEAKELGELLDPDHGQVTVVPLSIVPKAAPPAAMSNEHDADMLLRMGKEAEGKRKPKAALGYYKEIVAKYPESGAAKSAAERIKALEK
jgi:hypothetical protein